MKTNNLRTVWLVLSAILITLLCSSCAPKSRVERLEGHVADLAWQVRELKEQLDRPRPQVASSSDSKSWMELRADFERYKAQQELQSSKIVGATVELYAAGSQSNTDQWGRQVEINQFYQDKLDEDSENIRSLFSNDEQIQLQLKRFEGWLKQLDDRTLRTIEAMKAVHGVN